MTRGISRYWFSGSGSGHEESLGNLSSGRVELEWSKAKLLDSASSTSMHSTSMHNLHAHAAPRQPPGPHREYRVELICCVKLPEGRRNLIRRAAPTYCLSAISSLCALNLSPEHKPDPNFRNYHHRSPWRSRKLSSWGRSGEKKLCCLSYLWLWNDCECVPPPPLFSRGEVGAASTLAPKVGPLGMSPKKVGEDIKKVCAAANVSATPPWALLLVIQFYGFRLLMSVSRSCYSHNLSWT